MTTVTIRVPDRLDLSNQINTGDTTEFVTKFNDHQSQLSNFSTSLSDMSADLQQFAASQEGLAAQVELDKQEVADAAAQVALDKQMVTDAVAQVASDKQSVTDATAQVASDKQVATAARDEAVAVVSTLPEGVVDDASPSPVNTYSSEKIEAELVAAKSDKMNLATLMKFGVA